MRGMATMRWPTSWQATPRLRRRGRANARATGSLGFADFRAGAVLQDRLDRILGRRLAGIAFGPEDGLAVIFEIGDELALLFLLELEIDRKSVVLGKVLYVSVGIGGVRIIK